MDIIGPRRRYSHVAAQLDHYILVFGGTWQNDDGVEELLSHREIWVYNIYLEQWRKHVIPDQNTAPPATLEATVTKIGCDIYMFGGWMIPHIDDDVHKKQIREGATGVSNALWKLSKTLNGSFAWQHIKAKCKKKSPSPRYEHNAWEFADKLWTFGGCVTDVVNQSDYLNNYGYRKGDDNNQLLCFDPSYAEWTNPQYFGDIPKPCSCNGMTIIKARAWLFGGLREHNIFYELNMHSLTWTLIKTSEDKPYCETICTLTAITEKQLVLHSASDKYSKKNTWILDLPSMSWRRYSRASEDRPRRRHTCTRGFNSSVIIIGGLYEDFETTDELLEEPLEILHIILEAKTLQQLAIQTIYKHKHALPWQETLPMKLKYLFV